MSCVATIFGNSSHFRLKASNTCAAGMHHPESITKTGVGTLQETYAITLKDAYIILKFQYFHCHPMLGLTKVPCFIMTILAYWCVSICLGS